MISRRTKDYVLYAVGEIALVVVGILLALQINNWNEERIQKRNEVATLRALQGSFMVNLDLINQCLSFQRKSQAFGDTLLFHTGPTSPIISAETFGKCVYEIGETPNCELSLDLLEDVKNSGKLSAISNEEIRLGIGAWSSKLSDVKNEEENFAMEFSTQFMPFTNKHVSWIEIDYKNAEGDGWSLQNAAFGIDHREIMMNLEFANIVNQHMWRNGRIIYGYTELKGLTNKLLELIDQELVNRK